MKCDRLGIVVSAAKFANEMKYLNSAPDDCRELQNVTFGVALYNGRLQPVIKSTRTIEAGEELLGRDDYGKDDAPVYAGFSNQPDGECLVRQANHVNTESVQGVPTRSQGGAVDIIDLEQSSPRENGTPKHSSTLA